MQTKSSNTIVVPKIIVVGNKTIIILPSGTVIERTDIPKDLLAKIRKAKSEEEVYSIIEPEYKTQRDKWENAKSIKSNILVFKEGCYYWKEVSSLSLPIELVESILKAEKDKDELLLETYRNFWTLMSLNTDELCRNNLYKFLNHWGFVLARCGFFVAYRNVESTNDKDSEGREIFTDQYSHSTRIVIGEMVTLDRDKCDCDSNVECSRGLHAASAQWLENNYCGNQGMAVLVNPADVVAVPMHNTSYGKLRTCAYLPIDKVKYDSDGKVIPLDVRNGFDCSYVSKVIYEGLQGTETDSPYRITVPNIEEKNRITENLFNIALNCIIERNKQLN